MKYLVVSDSHGDRDILVELIEKYGKKVDKLFHCGDSELLDTDSLWKQFIVVKGNCDYEAKFPESVIEQAETDTIYITHGHLCNVGFTLNTLALRAKKSQATIVLFGHTHKLGCEMQQNILYLNPGSISYPRGDIQIPTYAIIESTLEKIEVQYFSRDHQRLEDLHVIFKKEK